MNITKVNNNFYNQKQQKETSFSSSQMLSTIFMAVDKHEILGVSAIDLSSMVIPRSVIDATRNKEAGIETAIREASSTATHASIGLAGVGAAALLAQGLKHKNYNVDFKNVTANNETVDGMAKVFKQILTENPTATKEQLSEKFLNKVFEDVKGLAGNSDNTDSKLWYSLQQNDQNIDGHIVNTKKSIINILLNEQKTNKSFNISHDALSQINVYMNSDIPSTKVLSVKLADQTVLTKGEHFIPDAYALSKAFTQDNVINSFKNNTDALKGSFVQDLKNLSNRKTVLGLAAICAVALSMQSINRYLTKKRTGIDGFVGDPNYAKNANSQDKKEPKKKDHTFLPLKLLTVMGMGFVIFKTLNVKGFKELAAALQFKGKLPTMDQIKMVYGSTILGRLIASSDKNELRESSFRDFLGYTNFLVIGALVTKCFVNWKDKSLINYDAEKNGKGLLNWIKNSTIKTHQEIINNELKLNVLKDKGIKSLKEITNNNWIQPNGKIAQKLSILNKAQLIGMLYSCVALGILVPLINKWMTERNNNKSVETNNNLETNSKPTNIENTSSEKSKQIINDFLHRQIA